MSIINYLKERKKLTGIVAGLVAVAIVFAGLLSNAFASVAYYFPDTLVELDGVNDGTMTVSFNTPEADDIAYVRGNFDTLIGYDMEHMYFTLTGMSTGGDLSPAKITNNTVADGLISWSDWESDPPIHVAERGQLLSATYIVDKDTPAGNHSVCLRDIWVASGKSEWDTININSVCANIEVTRSDTPAEKPTQVVTFRDGDDNPITEITKYYGDEDFEIKKEVTTGDGAILEYHPDDDGTGRVAHTDPDLNSNVVGVGEPGDVEICAWVEGTGNYAATKACYTVHVLKRPITISSVTIEDKTYDGTPSAVVTSVSFENGVLTNEQYNVTSAYFTGTNAADAGVDKPVRVNVELAGTGVDYYTLSPDYYTTIKTISPFNLSVDGASFASGEDEYAYDPDGVEPEIRVEANTHGGTSVLVEGEDFEVEYVNNTVAGQAQAVITGLGNYTTSGPGIVLPFTINPKGIINENVNAPSSIVEGRILAPEDVSVNVDGHTLTRCATDGEMNCDYVLTISGDNDGEVGHTVHVAVNGRNNYDGAGVADVNIVAKQEQTVTIEDVTDTIVNKSYGDANFTYVAISTGNGDISYRSTAEAVATVDMNTGEVSIVGVGDADIIATAAENDTYAEGSAKYTVHVDKKVITVTNATVADKTFDNTPVATVSDVTLSEGSLVYNADFTATGLFNDVTPAIRNVNVMVALTNEAYKNYCFMYESSCIQNTSYAAIGTIMPFTLGGDNAVAELTEDTFVYNGSEQCPAANVRVDLNGNGIKDVVLSAGTDYDVVCDNNVNVGTSATATITGKGNYTGSLEGLTFSITPATVEDVAVTAASQDYTGEPLEPVVTVTGTVNGESKTFTTDDYEVAPHGNFITAGDYTVTINPKVGSNYSIPSTSGTFTINKVASGTPAESSQNLKIEAGKTLSELGDLSEGFVWADGSTVVSEGSHDYDATYTKNGDTENYVTENVSVIVYGLKRIEITTAIFAGGEVMTPGGTALEGDEISWTITPDEGYELWRFSINTEDKTSEVSDGQFTMTAGTEDIMAIVYFRRLYQFIDSMGQTHVRGVDGTAEFEIDADYELFEDGGRVFVDGELLDEENYRAWSGSTMIELSADYLNSLTIGEHTLAVEFDDGGIARTTFVIADPEAPEEEKPAAADTGVFTGMRNGAIATGLSMVTMGAVAGLLYGIKKRNNRA
ncbi:hypothetical protein IKF30_03175 [Candidatus Saccharibacteria bacterium]|nr:hypothetical protein [Candidatus Saccharibacteria bacterium]